MESFIKQLRNYYSITFTNKANGIRFYGRELENGEFIATDEDSIKFFDADEIEIEKVGLDYVSGLLELQNYMNRRDK